MVDDGGDEGGDGDDGDDGGDDSSLPVLIGDEVVVIGVIPDNRPRVFSTLPSASDVLAKVAQEGGGVGPTAKPAQDVAADRADARTVKKAAELAKEVKSVSKKRPQHLSTCGAETLEHIKNQLAAGELLQDGLVVAGFLLGIENPVTLLDISELAEALTRIPSLVRQRVKTSIDLMLVSSCGASMSSDENQWWQEVRGLF